METYEYKNIGQMDPFQSNLLSEDGTDTIEFEISPSCQAKKKNITFVENDAENGIIILNTSSCCFYKHSHNIPHDHLAISRGIQCGNGLNAAGNPLRMTSDYSNNQQTLGKSSYRYFQYPKNGTNNQDLVKPSTVMEYPVLNKWENVPKCPSLRESEKFRFSQEEPMVNKSFTLESNNNKPTILKSIMKANSKLDYLHRNTLEVESNSERINGNHDHIKYGSLCSELKDLVIDEYSHSEHVEFQNDYEDVDANSILNSYEPVISEVVNSTERIDFSHVPTNKDTTNEIESVEDHSDHLSECLEKEEIIKPDIGSTKDSEEESAKHTSKPQRPFTRRNRSVYGDYNNSNFHSENYPKTKHTSYFTESINSRNIVRAKYCSEKSVKHKFFLSENANIELVLQDPSDRRIKSVCDKFNCDIDVYSKVIKSGYLKNIVVISAPNYDCLRKCVRSLDSYMNWCLTCQLNS